LKGTIFLVWDFKLIFPACSKISLSTIFLGGKVKAAFIGAGAVGGYFGGLLARARGQDLSVALVGRPAFCKAVLGKGLVLDTVAFKDTIAAGEDRPLTVTTEISDCADADLIFLCVKTYDTRQTVETLIRSMPVDAKPIIISMQNGVDNQNQIEAVAHQSHAGIKVLPAAVYVACSMPEPGYIKHVGRGDIVLSRSAEAQIVQDVFNAAGIACKQVQNIDSELWTKFIWNCAANGISGLLEMDYGDLTVSEHGFALIERLVDELYMVARQKGIALDLTARQVADKLHAEMPRALSSTCRDLISGKPTEIEALNGYIYRQGRQLGLDCAVNETIYRLVAMKETKQRSQN